MSTNLPAQSLLALAENDMTLLRNALMTAAARLPVLQDREEAYAALKQINAYRAARAASPRTLEEDILADLGRGFIKSDEVERQNRYPTDDEQAEMEKVLVRFEEHARRLAGEGGAA